MYTFGQYLRNIMEHYPIITEHYNGTLQTCHIVCIHTKTCYPKAHRYTATGIVFFLSVMGSHNVSRCKTRRYTTTGIVFSCGTHRRGAILQLVSFLGTKKRGTFRLPNLLVLCFKQSVPTELSI